MRAKTRFRPYDANFSCPDVGRLDIRDANTNAGGDEPLPYEYKNAIDVNLAIAKITSDCWLWKINKKRQFLGAC